MAKKILSVAVLLLWVIAVRAEDTRFWLEGEVNGHPARLVFDTGSATTAFYPESARRLGLEVDINNSAPNSLLPEKGKVTVKRTKVAELKVGGATFKESFAIFPRDLSFYDEKQDGMFGWEECSDNVFIIEAATMTLKVVGKVPKEAGAWTRFRVLTNYNVLALEIPGQGTNMLTVLIDTGKDAGVTLSPQRWEQWTSAHQQRQKTPVTYFMAGTGNVVQEESWADKMELGALTLTDVPVMEANATEVVSGKEGYAASLGIAALKRLDLVVDGKNNYAYMRPRLTPPIPYEHNRLGATFTLNAANELTAWVIPGSPAAEAGIHDGDILITVGDKDVVNLFRDREIAPLVLDWQRPADTRITLGLMRDGVVSKITVTLRDMLKPEKPLDVSAKDLASEAAWVTYLGLVAYVEGKYAEAIRNFTETIRLQPNNGEAFANRAVAYSGVGSNDLAMVDLNLAIRLDPTNAEAFGNRGTIWSNAGHDPARAIADYDESLRLRPHDVATLRNRGASLEQRGDPDRALVDFNEAIQLAPDYAFTFVQRGNLYSGINENDRAFADYSNAIRLKPDLEDAYNNRGIIFRRSNNLDAAISDFNAALRLNPTNSAALANRSEIFLRKSKLRRAFKDANKALQLNPNNVEALMVRGELFNQKTNYDRAIADLSRAIELNSTAAVENAYVNRMTAYQAIGEHAKAVADLTVLIRIRPKDAATYINRGNEYFHLGKYDEAIADYTEVIRLKPNIAAPFNNRAYVYLKKDDYAHAVADYEQVIQLGSGDHEQYRAVAQLLATCPDASVRDGKKAVEYASKACELMSWKDAATVDTLSMAYAAAGDFTNAIKWEKTFLAAELPPEVKAAAEARMKLYQEKKPYIEAAKAKQ